eukprot:1251767-Prymnesium_polylepis.1
MPAESTGPYTVVGLCRGSLWGLLSDHVASVVSDAGLGWALLYYGWGTMLHHQGPSCYSRYADNAVLSFYEGGGPSTLGGLAQRFQVLGTLALAESSLVTVRIIVQDETLFAVPDATVTMVPMKQFFGQIMFYDDSYCYAAPLLRDAAGTAVDRLVAITNQGGVANFTFGFNLEACPWLDVNDDALRGGMFWPIFMQTTVDSWDGKSLVGATRPILGHDNYPAQPAMQVQINTYIPSNATVRMAPVQVTSSVPSPDPLKRIVTKTRVNVTSSVDRHIQTTTTETIVTKFADINHTMPIGEPNTTQGSVTTEREPVLTLQLVGPASSTVKVAIREMFEVQLILLTEAGLPVVGKEVHALLLDRVPRSTGEVRRNVSLTSGSSLTITDKDGIARFNISFRTGASGNYSLLFGGPSIFAQLNTPAKVYSAATEQGKTASFKAEAARSPTSQSQAALVQTFMQDGFATHLQSEAAATQDLVSGCASSVAGGDVIASEHCISDSLARAQVASTGTATTAGSLDSLFRETALRGGLSGLMDTLPPPLAASASMLGVSDESTQESLERIALVILERLPIPAPWSVELTNEVNVVEQSSPFVGYGLSVGSPQSRDASGMSTCVLDGYARFVPSPQ